MRIFGGHRMQSLMLKLGMEEDVPIESRLITKRIEAAQKAVETQHFEARKHILEYDDVMNKQREAVYGMRLRMLRGEDQRNYILGLVGDSVGRFVEERCPERSHPDTYDLAGLRSDLAGQFGMQCENLDLEGLDRQGVADELTEELCRSYETKAESVGRERMRYSERMIMLQLLDQQWKDHLLSMDHLKEGIGLRGYGQKDPLVEYKKESFQLFQDMMSRFEEETIRILYSLRPSAGPPEDLRRRSGPMPSEPEEEEPVPVGVAAGGGDSLEEFTRDVRRKKERELAHVQMAGSGGRAEVKQVVRGQKVGRNQPCPCGSGKKYKKCCGRVA
jgi:preprotein translocase subunit SecA